MNGGKWGETGEGSHPENAHLGSWRKQLVIKVYSDLLAREDTKFKGKIFGDKRALLNGRGV